MKQPDYNQKQTSNSVFRALFLFLCSVLLTNCAADTGNVAQGVSISPWRTLRKLADVAPSDQVALWTDGDKTLVAWPGEPALPGIRIADVNAADNSAKNLALGRVPRHLAMYSAADTLLHILWLDQTLPGETHLASALITTSGEIAREPAVVSNKPTAEYSAAAAPSGDVLTAWTTSGNVSSLYLQLVDGAGRAHPSVYIAERASYPAVAIDADGNFHVSWLEAQTEQLWTIQHITFASNALPDSDTVHSTPIGVIRLNKGEALEAYSLGSDATHIYCLWEIIGAGQDNQGQISGPRGSLGGLSFPVGTVNGAQQILNFETTDIQGTSLRWLSVAALPEPTLAVAVLLEKWDGQKWQSSPALLPLTSERAMEPQPIFAAETEAWSKPTLAADSNGLWYAAWMHLGADGGATVYYASTR